jgi:hypothetical protein
MKKENITNQNERELRSRFINDVKLYKIWQESVESGNYEMVRELAFNTFKFDGHQNADFYNGWNLDREEWLKNNDETTYILKAVYCRIEKDDYENGCSTELFHSWEIPIHETFKSKKELIWRMNQELCGAEFEESDFDFDNLFDGNNIQTNVLVSYKPNIDWQEFYYRTEEELKSWKKGKTDLYNANFYFSVLPVKILTEKN